MKEYVVSLNKQIDYDWDITTMAVLDKYTDLKKDVDEKIIGFEYTKDSIQLTKVKYMSKFLYKVGIAILTFLGSIFEMTS